MVVVETTIDVGSVNWITLNAGRDVTTPVLYNESGKKVLVDMIDGEVTVPLCTTGSVPLRIRKGQKFGRLVPHVIDSAEATSAYDPK